MLCKSNDADSLSKKQSSISRARRLGPDAKKQLTNMVYYPLISGAAIKAA